MEVMMAKKATLSQLAAPLQIYPQVIVNVRVADKAAVRQDADVQAAIRSAESELGEDGRILVRESGTEPVIRVMVEARSEQECKRLTESVAGVIRAKGYAV